jgi:hypothetical protein
MPSLLLTAASGSPFPVISGNFWSGRGSYTGGQPIGGIQLRLDRAASGNAYISLSGGATVTSGNTFLSGGGIMDGMQMGPGDAYFIPKVSFNTSGQVNVYATCDPACSGQARLFWEGF